MKIKNYTSVCIKCAYCGNAERIKLNLFDFSGNCEKLIRCSKCGRVACSVNVDLKNRYRIEVSCVDCGGRHKFAVPISEFWHTPKKSFYCTYGNIPIFALGSDENTEMFLSEAEEDDKRFSYQKEKKKAKKDSEDIYRMLPESEAVFQDAEEFYYCVERFRILSEENKVSCDCGLSDIHLQVEEDGFRVLCVNCGRDEFFGFSTRKGIERIKSLTKIRLT